MTEKTITNGHKILTWDGEIEEVGPNPLRQHARLDFTRSGSDFYFELFTDSGTGKVPEWGKYLIPKEIIEVSLLLLNDGKLVPVVQVPMGVYSRLEKDAKKGLLPSDALTQLGACRFGEVRKVIYFINSNHDGSGATVQYIKNQRRITVDFSKKDMESLLKE